MAAGPMDVHSKMTYEGMYSAEEEAVFKEFLSDFSDVWRELHPEERDTFTVWDEKTSARAFNQVMRLELCLGS